MGALADRVCYLKRLLSGIGMVDRLKQAFCRSSASDGLEERRYKPVTLIVFKVNRHFSKR